MKIEVEFNTVAELKTKLMTFVTELASSTHAEPHAVSHAASEAPAEKRAPGRPKKLSNVEVAQSQVLPSTPQPGQSITAEESMANANLSVDDLNTPVPEKTAPKFSLDDVRADLQQVINGKGPDMARAILKQFGAQKVSELKQADYGDIIKACHKALKG